jgi:hypothetical protein
VDYELLLGYRSDETKQSGEGQRYLATARVLSATRPLAARDIRW